MAQDTCFIDGLSPTLQLEGKHVILEPLSIQHVASLGDAACDGKLWELNFTNVPRADQNLLAVEALVTHALKKRDTGLELPFVVRRVSDNKIVGTTRFYAIESQHRNLSIGYTWYAKSAQRTAINTECKFMMLRHAFEQLNCISVQWHIDHRNIASQKAVERLGAVKEGVLRNHKIMPDGSYRHTHCYSMLDTEWEPAKQFLLQSLGFK